MSEPIETETRDFTLEDVVKAAANASNAERRSMMPATVIKYDHKTGKCDAQPDFKRNYNGTLVDMPVIYNIPVANQRSGAAFMHMPLKKGHKVLLSFADRSLEKWLSNGEANDPEDSRTGHLSDAIATPGGYPFNDHPKIVNGDDVIIEHGPNMRLMLKENGHFQIFNKNYEFMKLLTDIMTDLSEAVTYTCNGPQRLSHARLRADMVKLRSFLEG